MHQMPLSAKTETCVDADQRGMRGSVSSSNRNESDREGIPLIGQGANLAEPAAGAAAAPRRSEEFALIGKGGRAFGSAS